MLIIFKGVNEFHVLEKGLTLRGDARLIFRPIDAAFFKIREFHLGENLYADLHGDAFQCAVMGIVFEIWLVFLGHLNGCRIEVRVSGFFLHPIGLVCSSKGEKPKEET